MNKTQTLYEHAKKRIPGAVQLFSKLPELKAPGFWPAYFNKASGCETWDLDGKHYYDMSNNGIGACLLGFCDPDVDEAVKDVIDQGSKSSLNPPEEVELADLLCEIHPWADQVRYARTGGEIMAVAARIARATTDRSVIAVCGYHGWHDWYLAANLGDDDSLRGHLMPGLDPLGVPRELRGTTVAFTYDNFEGFQEIIDKHGDRLAAVIMEPCRYNDPAPGFLELIRSETERVGALLVFDEITIGWRALFGGMHLKYGIKPDMAVFAKTISNGYPMAAVIGTEKGMSGAHESFISSTYWTERIGPAAALATIKKMREVNVVEHVAKIGTKLMDCWRDQGEKNSLPVEVADGFPALAHFKFDHERGNALKTIFIQMMLERGFLATPVVYPTLAVTDEIVDKYDKTLGEVFQRISQAIASGDIDGALKGPEAQQGFKRLL